MFETICPAKISSTAYDLLRRFLGPAGSRQRPLTRELSGLDLVGVGGFKGIACDHLCVNDLDLPFLASDQIGFTHSNLCSEVGLFYAPSFTIALITASYGTESKAFEMSREAR
jgi:hypothetical protein